MMIYINNGMEFHTKESTGLEISYLFVLISNMLFQQKKIQILWTIQAQRTQDAMIT